MNELNALNVMSDFVCRIDNGPNANAHMMGARLAYRDLMTRMKLENDLGTPLSHDDLFSMLDAADTLLIEAMAERDKADPMGLEDEQPDRCESGCSGDVGNRCAICNRVIPEPPDGLGDDAWSGGFAKNH